MSSWRGWTMSAGWRTAPSSRFTTETSALKLAKHRIGVLKVPARLASPLCMLDNDQGAHALVLQAVGLALGEVELEPDRQRTDVVQHPRVPGHRPAVELERGGEEQQAVHAVGPVLGEVRCQDAAHRQAAGNDDVAMLPQPVVGRLDARVPFPPGRAPQLLGRAAVAGELAAIDGVAGAGQTLRDEAQLDRRPAETVHEQHADAPAANELAAVRDLLVGSGLPLLRDCPSALGSLSCSVIAHAHPMMLAFSTTAVHIRRFPQHSSAMRDLSRPGRSASSLPGWQRQNRLSAWKAASMPQTRNR